MAGGARYDGTALGPNGRGPISHATIAVLTQPANTSTTPGSPLATIYTDATLGTISPNPFQADVLGNFHFYADPLAGPFTIQIYGPQVQTPYAFADQGMPPIPGSNALMGNASVTGTFTLPSQTANKFLGSPSGASGAPSFRVLAAADIPVRTAAIYFTIDGGGAVPSTGSKGQIAIPTACTVTGWTLTADASGSAVIDVLRSTYASFPTTASIAGTDKPTLTSVQKNQNTGPLSNWGSTALVAGDQLQINLNSVTTCQRLNLTLTVSIPYA